VRTHTIPLSLRYHVYRHWRQHTPVHHTRRTAPPRAQVTVLSRCLSPMPLPPPPHRNRIPWWCAIRITTLRGRLMARGGGCVGRLRDGEQKRRTCRFAANARSTRPCHLAVSLDTIMIIACLLNNICSVDHSSDYRPKTHISNAQLVVICYMIRAHNIVSVNACERSQPPNPYCVYYNRKNKILKMYTWTIFW